MKICHILVVEDSDEDFAALARAFKQQAAIFTLHRCARAEEALEFLYQRGAYQQAPRPALILLDLNLPGLDGRIALQRLKQEERLKTIPVIVLTTSSNPKDILECYRHGANSYQIKIVNYPAFQQALQRLLAYWLETATLPSAVER